MYTTGGFLEFRRQGGFFELEIQRRVGTYNMSIGIPGPWGVSRGDRQECECMNKLMTPFTTAESMIRDKHQSVMYVFAFTKEN